MELLDTTVSSIVLVVVATLMAFYLKGRFDEVNRRFNEVNRRIDETRDDVRGLRNILSRVFSFDPHPPQNRREAP